MACMHGEGPHCGGVACMVRWMHGGGAALRRRCMHGACWMHGADDAMAANVISLLFCTGSIQSSVSQLFHILAFAAFCVTESIECAKIFAVPQCNENWGLHGEMRAKNSERHCQQLTDQSTHTPHTLNQGCAGAGRALPSTATSATLLLVALPALPVKLPTTSL